MMKLVGEFFGSFVILYAVAKYGTPLAIGLAVALALYFFGHMSGGHFNPAVTFAKFLKGGMSQQTFLKYVVAQLAAAYALVTFVR
jgi:aquaporin Z